MCIFLQLFLNIRYIIIDYSFGNPEYKNIQILSFDGVTMRSSEIKNGMYTVYFENTKSIQEKTFYLDNKLIASEKWDEKGNLIHAVGVMPSSVCNSIYGCFGGGVGSCNSKLLNSPAMGTMAIGRNHLMMTALVATATAMGKKVIYSDTDSCFIVNNDDDVERNATVQNDDDDVKIDLPVQNDVTTAAPIQNNITTHAPTQNASIDSCSNQPQVEDVD